MDSTIGGVRSCVSIPCYGMFYSVMNLWLPQLPLCSLSIFLYVVESWYMDVIFPLECWFYDYVLGCWIDLRGDGVMESGGKVELLFFSITGTSKMLVPKPATLSPLYRYRLWGGGWEIRHLCPVRNWHQSPFFVVVINMHFLYFTL